jgi:hypothetical protein
MMRHFLHFIGIVVLFSSCVKENHFRYSPYGNIKDIEISNQASKATIDQENLTVQVEFPGGVDLSSSLIRSISLSSFATSNKASGDMLDLNQIAEILVTAENGNVVSWKVEPFIASSTPQLVNGDLNAWYQTSSGGYYEPGLDEATTIWGTGNPGTQILKLLATTPIEIEDDNLAAKLETLDNGELSGAFGAPISAGSIFTGKFDKDKIDPSNPQAAIDFGTPFSGRPLQLQFKYTYSPGPVNKDKNGNTLSYGDQCDVYAYLEIRTTEKIERLATAWFRSGDLQSDFITKNMDFTYGALDNSFPDYMKPENGLYVSADSASFVLPTHITFVASSSYDGANFAGAIDSELVVDGIEMVYE